jgi:hypothetical protein
VSRLRKRHIVLAFALVVLEVQSTEVLQGGDGKRVPNPLRQIAVLTVEPKY